MIAVKKKGRDQKGRRLRSWNRDDDRKERTSRSLNRSLKCAAFSKTVDSGLPFLPIVRKETRVSCDNFFSSSCPLFSFVLIPGEKLTFRVTRFAGASGTRGRQQRHQQQPSSSSSLCPSGKKKRPRTAFTSTQIQGLESEFERSKYLSVSKRWNLSVNLGLTETQVRHKCR